MTTMGKYDLPAELDFVSNYTGFEKIAYIGHSQGTAQMYYGLAELQDYYASRVSVFVALGSVTLLENTTAGYLTYTADNYEKVDDYLALWNVHEIMADKPYWWNIEYHTWCDANQDECFAKGETSVTSNPEWDDEERFMVYGAHNPSGASVRSLLFFAQNIKMNRFQQWAPKFNQLDPLMNKRVTDLIPLENISKVPIAVFVGSDDIVADPIDGQWTVDQIGAAVFHY